MSMYFEPYDRLTQIANDLGHHLPDHPLYQEGDRVIILMDDGSKGGIGMMYYEDLRDALIDLVQHVRATAKAFGINIDLVIPERN